MRRRPLLKGYFQTPKGKECGSKIWKERCVLGYKQRTMNKHRLLTHHKILEDSLQIDDIDPVIHTLPHHELGVSLVVFQPILVLGLWPRHGQRTAMQVLGSVPFLGVVTRLGGAVMPARLSRRAQQSRAQLGRWRRW